MSNHITITLTSWRSEVRVLYRPPPYAFGFGWLTPWRKAREGNLRRGSVARSLDEGGLSPYIPYTS